MSLMKLETGEVGEFVRNYGSKIQVRMSDGRKVTGLRAPEPAPEPANPAKPAKQPAEKKPAKLGSNQELALNAIRNQSTISYSQIGTALGVNTPTAATVVKSLLKRGLIRKFQDGKLNRYEIQEP